MMNFYGNNSTVSTLERMLDSERVSHAFLLCGDKGLGKKTLASALALKLVNAPTSRSALAHPDIIWAEHEGKSESFTLLGLRELRAGAYTLPNDADKKVYILADCDGISAQAQDVLLKIIEEPPPFVHFILTATDKSVFLPTILSRVISFSLTECSEGDCRAALTQKGFSEGEIDSAVSFFGGNIGNCEAYISGQELKRSVEIANKITDSIIRRSEYGLLKALSSLDGEKRQLSREVLCLLSKTLRDGAVLQLGGKTLGCYPLGAERLSEGFTIWRLDAAYDAVQRTILHLDSNVNMNAELSALCGQLIGG